MALCSDSAADLLQPSFSRWHFQQNLSRGRGVGNPLDPVAVLPEPGNFPVLAHPGHPGKMAAASGAVVVLTS